MGEGNTPLVESARVGPMLGLRHLYFKLETGNPTGSCKDRFAAAEVQRLAELGRGSCVSISSGNTGAALAAYCARAGLRCAIVVNPATPAARLTQIQGYGARLLALPNFATDAAVTRRALETLENGPVSFAISSYRYCAEGMAGMESIGAEIRAQCPEGPHHVFVPVGGGGLLVAVARGLGASGRVHAVQPAGCPTLVGAFDRGDERIVTVQSTTRIAALSVPFDMDASLALRSMRERGGIGIAVSDEEIWEAQRQLMVLEGIFCEPAGAAALAGLKRAARRGAVSTEQVIVCVVTGHGFKDPESASAFSSRHPMTIVTLENLAGAIV